MIDPPTYNYPPGTTPEAIEAFRTMFGQTPEEDIRLSSTFGTFLKGFVCGRISMYQGILDLESFKDTLKNHGEYGDYTRSGQY